MARSDHPFPSSGRSAGSLLGEIAELRSGDLDWRSGRAFSLVYDTDDEPLESLIETVGAGAVARNALEMREEERQPRAVARPPRR